LYGNLWQAGMIFFFDPESALCRSNAWSSFLKNRLFSNELDFKVTYCRIERSQQVSAPQAPNVTIFSSCSWHPPTIGISKIAILASLLDSVRKQDCSNSAVFLS
jgi:hypothetical protein